MMLTRRVVHPVYTFVLSKNGRVEVVHLESSSKTSVLNYFFQAFRSENINLKESFCYYFDKNGELKEMNLQAAYYRRKCGEEF